MTKEKLLMLYHKLQNGEITAPEISGLKNFSDEDIDTILSSRDKYAVKKLLSCQLFKTLPKPIQQQIIEIIDNCENRDNRWEAMKVATDRVSIESGHIVELVKIISEANRWSLKKAATIARNYHSVTSGKIIELTSIVAQCENLDEDYFVYIGVAAQDEFITRSGNVVDIVKKIMEAKDKEEALKILHKELKAVRRIGLLKALNKGNLTEVNFWDLFNEDSDRAIMMMLQEEFLLPEKTPYETEILEKNPIMIPKDNERLLFRENEDNECYNAKANEGKIIKNNPEILPFAKIRRKTKKVPSKK